MRVRHRATRLARDFFEQAQRGLENARLGLNLQARRARGPCGVAAQLVLFGRRNVTLGAVGELDVEGCRQRALRLELETGDSEHFIRNGGDSQVADAQGLQQQFALGFLM